MSEIDYAKAIQVQHIDSIVKVLDQIYGREYWDITIIPGDGYYGGYNYIYFINIYFPHVTVTNEHGLSIDLKDFFVQMPIQQDGRIGELRGKLNSPTVQQIIKHYHHSHLNSKLDRVTFQSFCTGRNFYNQLKGSYNNEVVNGKDIEESLFMLLEYVIKIVETESIAGVPFIKMGNLLFSNNVSEDYLSWDIKSILDTSNYDYYRHIGDLNWTFNSSGSLIIVDDELFEERLYQLFSQDYDDNSMIFFRKDSLGNYFENHTSYDEEYIDTYIKDQNNNNTFKFKGKLFPISLAEGAMLDNVKLYVHPKIKNHAKTIIERTVNERAIARSIEQRKSKAISI
jgi:hypothetical protein